MEFSRALSARRMVRRFSQQSVDQDQLRAVLQAGMQAPSAGFSQGVTMLALTGEQVDRFWQLSAGERRSGWLDGMRRAPVLILVWTSAQRYRQRYAEDDKARTVHSETEIPWWWVDAGAAIENILLAAVDLGLAAGLFGPLQVPALREGFGVPDSEDCAGVIALGHRDPSEQPQGSAGRRPRRADAVRYDRWN